MTMPKQNVSSSARSGQYDFAEAPQQELSLEELNKRNSEQVKKQLEGQKILAEAQPTKSLEQTIGDAVVDAVIEPFKTIGKGLSQLGIGAEILDPNKSISEKVVGMTNKPKTNPIAGAINLATGITEIPMLIGTVPLNVMGEGLKAVGLGAVSEGVNKVFETVGSAPAYVAEEITEALEKHGAAQKIRSFVDAKTAEYGISTEPARIDPQTGQEIKEATNQATGLAAIVGLGALAHGTYKGLKENVQVQSALKDLGYSKKDVLKMKPEEAASILQESVRRADNELYQQRESLKQQLAQEKPRDANGKFVAKEVEKPQINEVVKSDLIPDAEKQTADLPQYEPKTPITEKPIIEPKAVEPTPLAKPEQVAEAPLKTEAKPIEITKKDYTTDGDLTDAGFEKVQTNLKQTIDKVASEYNLPPEPFYKVFNLTKKGEYLSSTTPILNIAELGAKGNVYEFQNIPQIIKEIYFQKSPDKIDRINAAVNKMSDQFMNTEAKGQKHEGYKDFYAVSEVLNKIGDKFNESIKPVETAKPSPEAPLKTEAKPIAELKPTEQVEQSVPKEPTKISDIPSDKVINEKLIESKELPEDIAITKQKMNDLREKVGLSELEKTAVQHIPETYERVKTEIDNGTRNPETLLKQIETGKKDLDPTQTFELAHTLAKETNIWNNAFEKIKEAKASGDVTTEALLRSIADESLAKIKRISDVASTVTSEWGRFGRFMQVELAKDYSIARTMQRAELYAPEGKIPEVSKSKLETYSADLVKVNKALQEYLAKKPTNTVEDFIAKAQRDYQYEQRKYKRVETKEVIQKNIESLSLELAKELGVLSANPVFNPRAIKLVGQLATEYVKKGLVTAEQLIDAIHQTLQEKISKEDIMKALSGYGKISQMTRSEVATKLSTAKREMKLLLSIEDAQRGIEPFKAKRTPSDPNPRIQNLQKLLKSVTKENVDVTDASKLKAQKTRVSNNITNYETMLKENRFGKRQRRPVIPDKELTDLKTKEHELKKQVELELYKIKRLGMTKWEKTKEVAVDVANIPRTILATADLSMPLRQGLPLGAAYPKMAAQAFGEMHKMATSDAYFKKRMTELEMSPNARVYEKMGIDFTGVGSDLVQLAKREESFISAHLLNKVPGLKHITRFSERGAVGYLNVLRQNVGDWQIKLMMEKGMTPENSLKAYQDVGKMINWGTGRSDLGWMERAPGVLNAIMFSPRNFVAKLHLMNPLEYIKLEPQARKLLMREQVATLAQGIMFLNLMKLNGATVETDPRSADFAKAKIGDTRIDMFGGFQQNAVFLTRLAYGIAGKPAMKNARGKIYKLDGKQFPFSTPLDLSMRFLRGKLSPQMTIVVDALAGRDMMGNEFGQNMQQEALNRFVPMVWQDMIDAQKELGWGALGTTLMGFYGAGTQTYKPRPAKGRGVNFNTNFNFN